MSKLSLFGIVIIMDLTGHEAKDLESWQEAFNYPLATTRQIEKQLRNDIAANKERLRTLVGGSYRDLLGTADRIIHLNERMQEAERLLGDVSLHCNLDIINKKISDLAEEQQQTVHREAGRRNLVAQLSLLHRCQKCLPRLFRRGGSIVTAAKVLAVSRLLHKCISREEDSPPLVELIRGQLASHRRRLLRKVDLILITPNSSLQELTDALCAFCIVTSSSSSDAMRHFHDLRLNEIRGLSNALEQRPEDVLSGFEYYLQSLRASAQLLGQHFPDATRDLRSRPILLSHDIQTLEELNLGRLEQFIPAEILSFVPWIKQSHAGEGEDSSVLENWSDIAFKGVCLGLKRVVDALSDATSLLGFRTRVLQIWLPVSVSTPTHSNSGVFGALRNVFNTRMKDLLRGEAESLVAIASDITSSLEKDDSGMIMTSPPIWDHGFVTAQLGRDASYQKQLTDRHLCHSKTTNTILHSLEQWTAVMSASLAKIQQLPKARWIDVIEEEEDVEEDDRSEKIERLLQKDDPYLYEQEHGSSLSTAILQLQNRTRDAAEKLDTSEGRKATFLIRTIRGIHYQITISFPQQDLTILSGAVAHLHQLLASHTTTALFEPLRSSAPCSFLRKPPVRALTHLWEGDPPLPTHPSPRVFKLLEHLTAILADQGPDLWSTDAVDAVKNAVRKRMMMDLEPLRAKPRGRVVDGKHEKPVNGEDGFKRRGQGGVGDEVSIQILFDLMYLSNALRITEGSAGADSETLDSAIEHSKETVSVLLDSTAVETLEARARDYWARTNLLFGLLS